MNKWQNDWANATENKLHEIKPNIKGWISRAKKFMARHSYTHQALHQTYTLNSLTPNG